LVGLFFDVKNDHGDCVVVAFPEVGVANDAIPTKADFPKDDAGDGIRESNVIAVPMGVAAEGIAVPEIGVANNAVPTKADFPMDDVAAEGGSLPRSSLRNLSMMEQRTILCCYSLVVSDEFAGVQ
jgi:hypothetical protein